MAQPRKSLLRRLRASTVLTLPLSGSSVGGDGRASRLAAGPLVAGNRVARREDVRTFGVALVGPTVRSADESVPSAAWPSSADVAVPVVAQTSNMSDYFQEAEAEYQAAVAREQAKRRAERERERAAVKAASKKVMSDIIEPLAAEHEQRERPAAPARSFLDEVRSKLPGITPQQQKQWRNEEYRARRAALVEAEMKQHRRAQQKDELGVNGLVNPPELDWDALDDDDDEL
jgi:hypothetical protein